METLNKYDKEFFYRFMWSRGYRGSVIEHLWNIFISGCNFRTFDSLGPYMISSLETFNKLYGNFYVKDN